MNADTLTTVLTALTVGLSVALAVGLPMLAMHVELVARRERIHRDEVARLAAQLAERDRTIDRYRLLTQCRPGLDAVERPIESTSRSMSA